LRPSAVGAAIDRVRNGTTAGRGGGQGADDRIGSSIAWHHHRDTFDEYAVHALKSLRSSRIVVVAAAASDRSRRRNDDRNDYAVALRSAALHGDGVLQPVLLLGRLGLGNHNATGSQEEEDMSAIQTWAAQQGDIVINVDRLSSQDNIATWHGPNGTHPVGLDH
jgi:hypothetical protein